MPKKNIIPRDRRIYIKPEDLPKLPKGIHVYRGVYGGLFIDKLELQRYKDEITDEKLRQKLESGEETAEAAREGGIDEEVEEAIEYELSEEDANDFILEYVKKRIKPIVYKGMGGIEDLELRLQSINEFISYCSGKDLDVEKSLKEVRPILNDARMLIESDNKFDAPEAVDLVEDFDAIIDVFNGNPPTAVETVDDFIGEYGDIFNEIFEVFKEATKNYALAWRLSKVCYLLLVRSTDEGNYGVSRALEVGLSGLINGSVRPESRVQYLHFNTGDVYDKALKYVDEKSLRCWIQVMRKAIEDDVVDIPDRLYRGVNIFEQLLVFSNLVRKKFGAGAVFEGNMISSFTADVNVAKEFSSVVIEISRPSSDRIFGGWWNSSQEMMREKEIVVLVDKEIPCKVYDYDGSFIALRKIMSGEEVSKDELFNVLATATFLLAQNALTVEKVMSEKEIKDRFEPIIEFVYENMSKLDDEEREVIEEELKMLKEEKVYSCIFGGDNNE